MRRTFRDRWSSAVGVMVVFPFVVLVALWVLWRLRDAELNAQSLLVWGGLMFGPWALWLLFSALEDNKRENDRKAREREGENERKAQKSKRWERELSYARIPEHRAKQGALSVERIGVLGTRLESAWQLARGCVRADLREAAAVELEGIVQRIVSLCSVDTVCWRQARPASVGSNGLPLLSTP